MGSEVKKIDLQQLEELKIKIKTLESYIESKSSELNKAKLEAEKISSYMNAVFECTPDAIVVTDLSGKMTLGNETAKKLLGNFIDQNISKFINLKKASFDGSSAISAECELITASGPIPVTLTSGSLIQGSDLQGHVYTFHDVRDARNAQAALEEAKSDSAAKSQFLANMSHEIRTPLNSVIGLSDYLIETSDFGENNQYLQQIRTSGVALLAIVNDVLDISKIEAGELNLEKVPFDIKAPILEVLDIFSHQAKSKNLYLIHEIGIDVKSHFIGDPSRIRQIIMNFVSNALKFTKSGGIEIRIDPALNYPNGFRISVVDTGMGISSSVMEKLFSPFKQGDDSTTRKFGGTGLGLSITKHLSELMGGMVGVESKEGSGSKFWAELPLESTHLESTVDAPTHMIEFDEFGLNSIKQYRPANILVAEDNPANQMVVKAMLGKLGHSVTIANNGIEAIQLFSLDGFFDIILMDFQMPEMGGIEACKEIRAQKNGHKIPIIAMTASALRHEVTAAKSAGMNDFLGKPVTMAELQRVVEKWAPVSKQTSQTMHSDGNKKEETKLEMDFSGLDLDEPSTGQNEESESSLDSATLEMLKDLEAPEGGSMIKYQFDLFMTDSVDAMKSLESCLSDLDSIQFAKEAHKFKSSCGVIGALKLVDLCQIAEDAGKSKNMAICGDIVEKIRGEIILVNKFISTYSANQN